jgi:hypothetical protein
VACERGELLTWAILKFYKRTAKPKNTLPITAAKLRAALGKNEAGAAPPAGALLAVGVVAGPPPKPVTGTLFVPEADGGRVEDMVVGREVLPR